MPAGAVFILVVTLAAGLRVHGAVAQPAQGLGVAVADFYAPSPLPPVEGIVPEELAADELTRLLAQSAGQQVTVLSRVAVRQSESAIGWRGSDVLRFARLQELARRLGANRVLVGWIQQLELDQGGGGGSQAGGGGRHFMSGFATVTVQVFDAKQGRIVSPVPASDNEIGLVRARVTERLLHKVLEGALPSVLSATVGGGR